MAHTHDAHGHGSVDVVERDGAPYGALIALAAIVVLALIAFAVLWSQPWDDDGGTNTNPNVPGISDDSVPGGGGSGSDSTEPQQPSDGGTGGGTDSGGGSGQ